MEYNYIVIFIVLERFCWRIKAVGEKKKSSCWCHGGSSTKYVIVCACFTYSCQTYLLLLGLLNTLPELASNQR